MPTRSEESIFICHLISRIADSMIASNLKSGILTAHNACYRNVTLKYLHVQL